MKFAKRMETVRGFVIRDVEKEFSKEVSIVIPDGGIFMWVELPKYFDTSKLLSATSDAGAAYREASTFCMGKDERI